MTISYVRATSIALAGLLFAGGCGEDVAGPDRGTIIVGLEMSGDNPDLDGCTVTLDDGEPQQIFAGSGWTFDRVLTGSHIVTLGDIADNCTLVGQNPRVVAAAAGETEQTVFDLSCGSGIPGGETLADMIAAAGAYEQVTPQDVVTDQSIEEELRDDGSRWSCTVDRHSAVDAPDDYATFNPNAEVVYPGSMLQGATLVDATPEPVVVRRAGGTVVINLLNASEGVAQDVVEVKQSTIVQAINDILRANSQIVPASFTYSSSEVQSRQQLALQLGVNVSTLTADLKTRLSFSTDRQYNRFLVQMVQGFYTVSFDLPRSLDELFDPSVTAAELAPYMGPGNPPAYISSVTYGRRFLLLVESTASVTDMQASIRASYDAVLANVDLAAGVKYVNQLDNVNIKVFALGGDQSLATAMFNGDFDALRDFLTQGADIRTGVPLSYVVRSVLDNSIVSVKVATDYDVKTCVPIVSERLYSGFENTNDVEGWTSYDNGSGIPVWRDAAQCGGGTGGCMVMGDVTGGYMRFRAPIAWRNEASWTPFYGGTIKYYAKGQGGSGWNNFGSDIQITGANGSLTFSLPRQVIGAMWAGWTSVIVDLTDAPTDFVLGGTTYSVRWQFEGHDATAEEINAVLANVRDFMLRGDYGAGTDYQWYDEIEVSQPESGG